MPIPAPPIPHPRLPKRPSVSEFHSYRTVPSDSRVRRYAASFLIGPPYARVSIMSLASRRAANFVAEQDRKIFTVGGTNVPS